MIQESSLNKSQETAASACDRKQGDASASSVKQQAHRLAENLPHSMDEAKEQAGQAINRLSESFHETSQQMKAQAGDASRRLREQGEGVVEKQKGRVADELACFSEAAHQAAERFDAQDDHNIAGYIHAAGEQLDRVAGYLRERNLNDLMDDAACLARRRPEVFLGGMFVAGLALARFLKASGRTSSRSSSSFGTEMHHESSIPATRQHSEPPVAMETQQSEPIANPLGMSQHCVSETAGRDEDRPTCC